MTCISINRVAIKPGSAGEFERIAAAWLRGERKRLPLEELIGSAVGSRGWRGRVRSDHALGDPGGP
jgi:hypothetical protein